MRRRPTTSDSIALAHAAERAWQHCGLLALRQMRLARAHGRRLSAANAGRFFRRQWQHHARQLPHLQQQMLSARMQQWLDVQGR